MKKTIALAAFLIAPFLTQAQTVTDITTKYVDAIGGQDKLSEIQAYTIKNNYRANAPTDYDEEVNAIKAETKFSRKKTLLGRDFFYVLNDKMACIKIPTGSRDKAPVYTVKDLSANERNDLVNELIDGLVPFQDFAAKGYKNNGIVTSAVVNGVDCYNFVLERNNIKKTYYFDKNTGLLKRQMIDNGTVSTTIDYSQYAETQNGLKFPSNATMIDTKDKRNIALTTALDINPNIAPSTFVK